VLIQGITGREGMARAKLAKQYGTNVVAGVTPGKGGAEIEGIPVFDTVEEATETCGPFDASAIFVQAPLIRNAAFEAIDCGVKLMVLVPDRVPLYDAIEIGERARCNGVRFIGPNTLGLITPGQAVLGMIGGRAETAKEWFKPGPVGVSCRSGGITTAISYYLTKKGIGQSTVVHVGGDGIVGLPHPEILMEFQSDKDTKAVVLFGEIGTSQEEMCADLIEQGKFTKPLVAFIGGAAAKAGTRFSHAGAIVEGNKGTHANKVKRLREAGANVVDKFEDIFEVTAQIIKGLEDKSVVRSTL